MPWSYRRHPRPIARAVAYGLITEHLPFVRTAKGGSARRQRVRFPAFYEALLGALLLAGAGVVFATNYESVREINIFGIVLMVQSLPFLSAALLAAIEETRLNDFSSGARPPRAWSRACSCRAAPPRSVPRSPSPPPRRPRIASRPRRNPRSRS